MTNEHLFISKKTNKHIFEVRGLNNTFSKKTKGSP